MGPVDVELVEICAPPGPLGLVFEESFFDGECGFVKRVAENSPIGSICTAGMVLVEMDGCGVGVLTTKQLVALLKSREQFQRRLKFRVSVPRQTVRKSLFLTESQLNVSFITSSRPSRISDIATGSALFGEVAIGATLAAIEDVDVTGLTFAEARDIYDAARVKQFYKLTFDTPVVQAVDLTYIEFFPRKTIVPGSNVQTYEAFHDLVDRANHFLCASQLDFINIETVRCEASMKYRDSTRHTSNDGGIVYRLLRVWFNRLAPTNRRREVRAAISRLRTQTEADIQSASNEGRRSG